MSNTTDGRPSSGLFSDLSRRFSPRATLTIRPRLQTVFESDENVEEFHEVTEEIRAEPSKQNIDPRPLAADAPQPEIQTSDRQSSPSQAIPTIQAQDPTVTNEIGRTTSKESNVSEPTEPATANAAPKTDTGVDTSTVNFMQEPTKQPPIPSVKPSEAQGVKDVEISDSVSEAIDPESRPQPLATRQPEPDGWAQQEELTDTRSVEPTEQTTIHIGRVVLRHSPPPKPQPKPQLAPVQTESPRRLTASGPMRAQASGLIDYLGWKKK